MWAHSIAAVSVLMALVGCGAVRALEVATTPDPERPRPLRYLDLRDTRAEVGTFREIWADALAQNGKAYETKGDLRYVGDVAPATEAHYIIWTPIRSVVFTVLNANTFCTSLLDRADIGIRVKLCPMRVAFYEDGRKRVTAGPKVCYLEWTDAGLAKADPYRSVAYAGYDRSNKTLSVSLTVDHKPIDACSFSIPLASESSAPGRASSGQDATQKP